MAEIDDGITLNDDAETVSLREWITKRWDHIDIQIHELRQAAERMEAMVTAMHAELESARPLIEKWQHSKIVQLAAGRFPWQQT